MGWSNICDGLEQYLRKYNLIKWNDHPERTYEEVIAALKACDL